ncbi:MAG: YbhB/YbcL family Raf kinase inhibitor-like protein [Candidatus Vogelbacteria bacterium]|nr:YbhB/YbcL family Raf kinase inhibitor-like protein [Candidatus Vogelbacteria bacterium]
MRLTSSVFTPNGWIPERYTCDGGNVSPPLTISGVPPAGVLGLGTAGTANYEGPCPPSGIHRYFFKLYALAIELSLAPGAAKAEVLAAMRGHILDQTELIGRYRRVHS